MLLLAVSGGIDSMYLLNRAGEFFPGEAFVVAHCNFNLRGEESDGDEAFVCDWCRAHEVEFITTRFDTKAHAKSKGISIEMAARELRYEWFAHLCKARDIQTVVVAHNANDNAETLILNLLRGTGSRGVRGMAKVSALPGTDGKVELLRPMLGIPRAEIEAWMTARSFTWREDSTNQDTLYKRNLIRNDVFPLFAQINPSFIRTLQRDMQHLAATDDIAEDYWSGAVSSIVSETATGISISVPGLLGLKHWKYVLWRALEPYNFSFETMEKLTILLEKFKNEPRGTVTLGGKTFESPTNKLKADSGKLVIL